MKHRKKEVQKRKPPKRFRPDIRIGTVRKRLGLDKKAIRNPNGTVARADKKLGTLREDYRRWAKFVLSFMSSRVLAFEVCVAS